MTCDWGKAAMGLLSRLWPRRRAGGFLTRLAHDRGGNTLAIMAAALIPLVGMVGGGIDISRMYITKTRLQHACDAGALAGRKSMGAGSWGSDDNLVAQQFFDANYSTGLYGSNTLQRSFTQSNGTVSGTASAVLPMTLTRVIGQTQHTLTVTCSSTMQLPNTDVMFVLDTTGSMNCVASDTSCTNNGNVPAPGSKIVGLKNAVKCFYEAVAQQRTNGTCSGTPSGNLNPSIQVRFGFVPYSSNVNVGYLLPPAYFASSWKYQSREPQWTTTTTVNHATSDSTPSNQTNTTATPWVDMALIAQNATALTNGVCPAPPNPVIGYPSIGASVNGTSTSTQTGPNVTTTTTPVSTPTTTIRTEYQWAIRSYAGYTFCLKQSRTVTTVTTSSYTHTDVATTVTVKTFSQWHYGQITTDISGLKNGTSWNTSMTASVGALGTDQTIGWDGCIEERHTVQTTNFSPIPSGANDLDIDAVPSQSDPNSLWAPALPDLLYMRNITTAYSQASTADSYTAGDYYNGISYTCPTAAKKLQVWSSVSDFDGYVDSLVASGNTYHDIGMLWGARLMSPTGIFGSENALAGNGGTINRNMIFMTDGDSTSSPCDYNAYGMPWWDQRQTTDVGPASSCGSNRQQLIDQINLRYAALCTAVKNKGINLYVISYGNGSSATTEQRLSDCASPGSYYKATDPTALQSAFTAIAAKITMLRLTQ